MPPRSGRTNLGQVLPVPNPLHQPCCDGPTTDGRGALVLLATAVALLGGFATCLARLLRSCFTGALGRTPFHVLTFVGQDRVLSGAHRPQEARRSPCQRSPEPRKVGTGTGGRPAQVRLLPGPIGCSNFPWPGNEA